MGNSRRADWTLARPEHCERGVVFARSGQKDRVGLQVGGPSGGKCAAVSRTRAEVVALPAGSGGGIRTGARDHATDAGIAQAREARSVVVVNEDVLVSVRVSWD